MKKVILIIGVIVALLVGYVAAGPYLTLASIKKDISEENTEQLPNNIDFVALRQNIKGQVNHNIMKDAAPELQNNILALVAGKFATKMVDGVVDSILTPNGLAALMEGKQLYKEQKQGINGNNNTNVPSPEKKDLLESATFSYDSLNQFSVHIPNDSGKEVQLMLKREGLSWKLVNIKLPLER